jgi:hypothetical protein
MATIVGETQAHATGLITGSRDASTGEVTSTIMYRVPTESDCRSYAGGPHPTIDIPEVSRSWSELEGCLGFDLTITYKGKPEADDVVEDDYSLDVSFSEEPIQSHPNWDYIKKLYRATVEDDKVKFQEYVRFSGKGKQSTVKGSKGFSKNPMFGVETWLVLKAVLRREYTSTKRPNLSMIGKIVKKAPGGFATPEDHDWLVMPPKSRRKGKGIYANTIEYLLSPIGGWPEGVYELMEGRADSEDDGSSLGSFGETGLGDEPFVPATGWEL